MSLTKLPLGRNNSVMTSLFPPRESLVVTSRLGTGNSRTFFLRCTYPAILYPVSSILYRASCILHPVACTHYSVSCVSCTLYILAHLDSLWRRKHWGGGDEMLRSHYLKYPEVVCTDRLAIGFKQMLCTVATCYWFLALLWFYKTRSFLSGSLGGGGGGVFIFSYCLPFFCCWKR